MIDRDKIITRIIHTTVQLGAAVFIFHALFFVLALVIQPPHWMPRGGVPESSGVEALSLLVTQDTAYRGQVASFFLVMAMLGLVFSVLTSRKKLLMNWFGTFTWFSVLSFVFSFFSTRGRQWYFEFGIGLRRDDWELIAASVLCFVLFVGMVVLDNKLQRKKKTDI